MSKCYAETVVALARQEKGYIEKATNSNLDSKTANAGTNNYTKYAAYIDTNYPQFYNGKKNGYEWCDVYVDYLFIRAYDLDDALRLTGQPLKSSGAGCLYSYNYYKAKGRTNKTPKVGSQVFFGTSEKSISHTGIVIAVEASRFLVSEGNSNNRVEENWYANNYAKLVGFGHPPYDTPETTVTPTSQSKVVVINPNETKQVIIQIQ